METLAALTHGLLASLALVIVVVGVWRAYALAGHQRLSPQQLEPVEAAVREGRIEDAMAASGLLPSLCHKVVSASVSHLKRLGAPTGGPGVGTDKVSKDAAKTACQATLTMHRLELENGQAILATIGNNAPFVGLLGTVLSVVDAFSVMSRGAQDATTQPALIAAISEALIATAMGLVVALPAIAIHNWFQRRIDVALGEAEAAALVCIAAAGE